MLRNRMKNRKDIFISIQTKLLFVFLLIALTILGTNLYIYININKMIANIDSVYESNAMLNELQNRLTLIHRYMENFLDTKDTEAIEGYLRNEQEYYNQLENLNERILNDAKMIAEKNIYNMSLSYLEITDKAIEAKRGRNVAKYREYYGDADELYDYLNSCVYSLNNQQFKNNSDNYEMLFSALKYSETSNLLILCMVSALNGVLIVFLTKGITNPLKELVKAANEVANGRLDLELQEKYTHDEVGIVTNAFIQMVKSLKKYIEQIRKSMELESSMKEKQLMMETHLRDAQLNYLRAQINPHFLFNTLNAGAQLAMMEGADRTYQYVQNVADFFRYNVKKNHDMATLREEIELVDNYIYIINVRFSGEINFKKKIDEELINVKIPSMILQPIVENCINHGIKGIAWENRIELSIYDEGGNVCISVRDNGVGMSKEKIERILHRKQEETDLKDAMNGVGLDNVIVRLRLFFDREDVIEITSAGQDMGTEVAIHIPLEV